LDIGKGIATFTGEGGMTSCAVAPGGRTIIAGEQSGRVHFLRLVEADKAKRLIGDTKIVLLHRKGTGKLDLQLIPEFHYNSAPSSRGFFTHLCSGCYLQKRKTEGATGTLVPVQEGPPSSFSIIVAEDTQRLLP
jgi:hypothetical protein